MSDQTAPIYPASVESKKNYQYCFEREMLLMKTYEHNLLQIESNPNVLLLFDFHADAMRGIVIAWEKIASHFPKFEQIPPEIICTVDELFARLEKHREECMKILMSAENKKD